MIEGASSYPKLSIQELKGLNERFRLSNPSLAEFDVLRNAIPCNAGSLSKMLGCKHYTSFSPSVRSPILSIVQTFDSSHNVIIQCRDAVYVMSENDLFGITTPASSLTPYIPPLFGQIIAITATNPATIQTGIAHGRTTGDWVILSGIVGGTFSVPINGTFQITVTDSTHFTVVSNCTVIPTDLTAAIFSVTVNPLFNGDDELYPEALIVGPIGTSTGVIINSSTSYGYIINPYGSAGNGLTAIKVYEMNPDGSAASFIQNYSADARLLKLAAGRYRLEGWARSTANASNSFTVNINGAPGTTVFTTESIVVTNENVVALFSGIINLVFPSFISMLGLWKTAITTSPFGVAPAGFDIHCYHLKITKTA